MTDQPQVIPPSVQARMSEGDPRLYNVNRDVAHSFREVAELVAGRLEDRLWPELATLLDAHGVDNEDLGLACQAYCKFVGSAGEVPAEGVQECLDRAGWFKVKPEAQIALMAVLGTVISGMQFAGVREATLGGEGPVQTLPQVLAVGEETAKFLARPRWQRRWMKLTARLRAAWKALFPTRA